VEPKGKSGRLDTRDVDLSQQQFEAPESGNLSLGLNWLNHLAAKSPQGSEGRMPAVARFAFGMCSRS
jgi:hypothetical protein